jgi:hypothetical protein
MPTDKLPPLMPRLIKEPAAAAYLGRSRTRFREQWRKGLAPAPSDRNGNIPLWDIKVLDRWVDQLSGISSHKNSWDDDD